MTAVSAPHHTGIDVRPDTSGRRTHSRRTESMPIIRDLSALNSENPPLNRRWGVAVAIVCGMAKRRPFKKVIDADVELAIDYIKAGKKTFSIAKGRSPTLTKRVACVIKPIF